MSSYSSQIMIGFVVKSGKTSRISKSSKANTQKNTKTRFVKDVFNVCILYNEGSFCYLKSAGFFLPYIYKFVSKLLVLSFSWISIKMQASKQMSNFYSPSTLFTGGSKRSSRRLDFKTRRAPVLNLVVGGNLAVLNGMLMGLQYSMPCLVVQNSGGAADFLDAIIRKLPVCVVFQCLIFLT